MKKERENKITIPNPRGFSENISQKKPAQKAEKKAKLFSGFSKKVIKT